MSQVDMSAFIAPKSDQLNADDLIGGPRTIRITRVSASPESAEQPVSIYFEGDNGKPYKPCKSMRRVMVAVWGADASKYPGRAMTIYRDPSVSFGGMQVGGIRISHMSHINEKKTMALTATRAKRAPFTVQPLKLSDGPVDAFGLEPVTEGPAAPASDQPTQRQTAEQWVERYVSDVRDCTTIEDLMALQSRSSKALAKLQADRPELHGQAAEAGSKRAVELQEVTA